MGKLLSTDQQNSKYYLWLLFVCLVLFISNLDVVYVNIMEARNFISAREMLTHGNWLHTTLNLAPRYEKPPLPTWFTALAMGLFGKNNLYGLRLPAVIAVIILIFSSFKLVTLVVKNNFHAFISSLILATSFYIIFSGRNAQWDIFAHSFMMLAIWQIFIALKTAKISYKNWLLAGLFMGLSILSKGPVSLFALFLPFAIAYGFTYKFNGFSKQLKPTFLALILALALGSWWAIYIYITDVQAVQTIAAKETVAWSNRNVRPWYYYWPFFTQSGMWTLFAFIGLLYPFIKKRCIHLKAYKFTLIWTLSAVVLLSLIPEKKSRYLLPVLIPLALNTSFYVHYLITKGKELPKIDKWLTAFGFGLLGLIALVFPIYSFGKFYESSMAYPFNFWIQAVVLISISFLIFRSLWQKNYKQSFYTSIALMCSIMFLSLPLIKGLYNNPKFNNLSHLKQDALTQNTALYVKGYIAPELLWEYGTTIPVYKSENDIKDLSKFGLITQEKLDSSLLNHFKTILKQRIDLNYMVKKSGKGNNRLITSFYLLEKKRDSLN
ncbi:MAG: glycosyltransferase family 39 protein [Flavobacteriaceae bacterium]